MKKEKIIKLLQEIGFSEYEARAYLTLLQRHPQNGYELAKNSGLPRANVYAVLQKLEERGAVVRLSTSSGVRYAPVPPHELTLRLGSRFQEALASAQASLETLASPIEHEYVWNARGYSVLLEEARALVEAAQTRLLVAIWPQEAMALAENLAHAETHGVEVTTLCMEACPQACDGCRGHLYRYRVAPEQQARWLVLVADGAEVLAGEMAAGEEALAVRTRQRLLVDLTAWYIRDSIALAVMMNDLGDRLESLLKPATRTVLASVGPGGQTGGWLEHMRQLLNQSSNRAIE